MLGHNLYLHERWIWSTFCWSTSIYIISISWLNEIFSFARLKTYGWINHIILSNIYLTPAVGVQPPIACRFQHLRNISCLHSSVFFSIGTGDVSHPVQLGQPMTLSCNSNQAREKTPESHLKLLMQALDLCIFKPPSLGYGKTVKSYEQDLH